MNKKPTVTVWMNSYNHEKFVAKAIESVLAQKNVDFEFLIADDGSTDNTQKVIETFSDKRIRFFPHKVNRGACTVTNELIQMASGEFLAKINSDDAWIGEDKLEYQLQIMRDNPALGACFGRPKFMDEDGNEIDNALVPHYKIFECKNGSQGQWLRSFYELLSFPCQPTLMIRKECFDKLGLYDNRLRQFPDYDFWVRLVKHYPLHIADRDMIYYRVLPGNNASAPTNANIKRAHNEQYIIFKTFFDDVNPSLLLESFSDVIKFKDFPTPFHLDIEKALLYFTPVPNPTFQILNFMNGFSKIHELLSSDHHREILENDYQINDLWFQDQLSKVGIFDSFEINECIKTVSDNPHQVYSFKNVEILYLHHRKLLKSIYRSNSWRFTAPLRKLSAALLRLKKKFHC